MTRRTLFARLGKRRAYRALVTESVGIIATTIVLIPLGWVACWLLITDHQGLALALGVAAFGMVAIQAARWFGIPPEARTRDPFA